MNLCWLEQTEPDVPADDHWLSPEESICLRTLRFPKRRTDWRLGRWTAKHAVAASLSLPTDLAALANLEIHAASSGAPEVYFCGEPADVAISLSHRAGTALCTVGPRAPGFGCDLEAIEPRSEAFIADYFTNTEHALIERTSLHDRSLLLALLWSAKESALKALRVGLRLDTRSMCVSPCDGWSLPTKHSTDAGVSLPDIGSAEWLSVSVRYSGGQLFSGWWRVADDLIRTVVSEAPLQTPRHARDCTGENSLSLQSRTSQLSL